MVLPWFKFFAGDFLADEGVTCLSFEERGVLVTLWAFAWREGSIPDDVIRVARMLGLALEADPHRLKWLSDLVGRFFQANQAHPGRLVSERMERERSENRERLIKASNSARTANDVRWNGPKRQPAIGLRSEEGEISVSDPNRIRHGSELDPSQSHTQKQIQKRGDSGESPTRPSKALEKGGIKGPMAHLPESLQVDFWRAAKLIPPDKFVNPTAAAKAWAAIIDAGSATGAELAGCLRRYQATFGQDRRCFMIQFHAWLDGSGFLAFLDAERRGDPEPVPLEGRHSGPINKRHLTPEERAHLEQMP